MKKLFILLLTMLSGVVLAYSQNSDGDGVTTGTDEPVKYTTLASSGGYNDQGADKLFDYNRDSKWCSGFTLKEEGETTNGAYVIFKTSRVMAPTHYTMVTAGDALLYPARNWKQWQLYGMIADSDEDVTRESEKWVPLDKKYDVGTDQLPATNLTAVDFTLSEENTTAYRYFKIELDKVAAGSNCMQMADFLLGDEYTPKCVQTDEQGVCYTLRLVDDGSFYYSVTGHFDEMNAEIVISADLDGCPVKTIEDNAFSSCSGLTSVTIPNGVTSIGARAFQHCNNLTTVSLGDQLVSVGRYAFNNCVNLSSIIIPNSVTSLGEFAFYGCSSLTSVTIGNSVTNLKAGTFCGCSGLNTLQIPNSVTSIEDASDRYAGTNDYGLLAGTFGVFSGCSSLSSITIPNSVTSIGGNAFKDCSGLKMITSEISTPFDVNAGWPNDATLVVPKGSRAYYKSVGGWNFAIILEEDETYAREQTDEQGLCYTLRQKDDGNLYYSVTGHSDELNTEIVIPADLGGCPVRTIEGYVFYYCTNLSSITIPNSVTSIGYHAFENCSNLNEVKIVVKEYFEFCNNDILQTFNVPIQLIDNDGYEITEYIIPEGVTTIGENAFRNCSGLTSITIPNSVTIIGVGAFRGCSNLTSIKIPNSVTNIGGEAFVGCKNLTSVKIGNKVSSIGDNAFNSCTGLSSIILPNTLESIGAGAFRSTSLTSVAIPGSVMTIGDAAFQWCSLASVCFENGLTIIGDNAFSGCRNLTSVTIPNSVTTIGESAFASNSSLTTVILGDGLTEIKSNTFRECDALTSVIIPDGVTSIGKEAFWRCRALTSIKLPESLTSMEWGVFIDCPIKSIELPNSFTIIPEYLFINNNFQYIKLGNNVKSIGENAFGSNELVIEIGTSTPPAIASDAFPRVEYLSDLNVIVPDSKAETAYRKANVWKEMTFSNQNNISEVTVDTPGDLSFELITECNMQPAKVVSLKVNGTINADDFTQMLVNMKSLLRLDLSDCDITEIPDEAMSGKTQLQELTLPTKLQTIGRGAFQNCPYLTGELDLPSGLTAIGESAFAGTDYTSVKLPSALKTIGDYAFNGLPIKQRLVLPQKVTSVGAYAFAGTQISGLVIPDGVKSIGDYAFAETPIQGHVTIPDGVTYLGSGAFRNSQISTVFLPNSVTTVSEGLFQGCPNLDLVYIPDNYTGVAGSAFDGCSALTILRLSANLASMGANSFQGTPLEYIKVPSQVEVLPQGVLKNCKNLVSLSLPANLKTVEAEAFTGCTALRNLSVEATTPPAIKNRSAIRGINTDLCLISIPTQSYRNYVLAEYWGQFVQMRNDIAVETDGNGEIAFESVDEEEEEEEVSQSRASGSRRAAARSARRASQLASEEESMTFANNGSSVYVPQQGKVRFYIIPGEGEELVSATLDGEDIMPYIVDGVYTATADKKNAKLVVKFTGSGQGSAVMAGDVNGDGDVDIADAVCIVNHVVGKANTTFMEAAADANGDGDIDIADAVHIVNYVVGKIPSLSRSSRQK